MKFRNICQTKEVGDVGIAIQYHARESFVPIGTVWGRIKIEESYESGQNMDMKNIEEREGERANMGEKGKEREE